jgi:YggT family protein
MIINVSVAVVHIFFRVLTLLVVIEVILSYFMSPFHPVRTFLGKIVNPLLAPIKRVIPPIQNFDLSPIVLIILLQVVEYLIVVLLISLN